MAKYQPKRSTSPHTKNRRKRTQHLINTEFWTWAFIVSIITGLWMRMLKLNIDWELIGLTIFAISLFAIGFWTIWYLYKRDLKRAATATEQWLDKLDRKEFEYLIADVLKAQWFTHIKNYIVGQDGTIKWSGDGWIDIEAYKNSIRYIIQCKKYNKTNSVWESVARDLNWVIHKFKPAAKGILVSTGPITKSTQAFCTEVWIEIWDYNIIMKFTQTLFHKEFHSFRSWLKYFFSL